MANIDRIVTVNIALRTTGIRQLSFSDLMLIGVTTMAPRVAIITQADDLLEGDFGLTTASKLYQAAQVAFAQTPAVARLYIGRRGEAEPAADAIVAIAAENRDWYGFTDVDNNSADVDGYSDWAEANQKLFLTTFGSAGIAAEGPAETLQADQKYRTAWWYTSDVATQWPQVAIAAKKFTTLPGGETWANATLANVTATNITETLAQQVFGLNGNTFEPFRDVAITQNGKTAAGEWIDIIRFRDWLQEEIRTRVFNHLVDNRVPYTDGGIASVELQVIGALELGIRRGGIAPPEPANDNRTLVPSYTTSVPLAASVSQSDKSDRILRDVYFTARLAGAIHATVINGTLTYENIAPAA